MLNFQTRSCERLRDKSNKCCVKKWELQRFTVPHCGDTLKFSDLIQILHSCRPLDYSINSYWINYWISFLVIFILLNKNFKKLFLFLMNKILGYLTIYSIILFFIIQLISLKIFRARSAREWIFIKRKKNFPKKPISELGTPPLKLNLPLL